MAYDILYGNETPSSKRVTQVYQATHVGEKYLPYMHRSFISFSFGGKNIEDFNLIAYTNGDRISRQGSSNFNNLTTNTDVLNGQLYWGTFFEGNTLDLELATDGMTQRQLDDFLRWFRGGETRELILAEHPNRGILARVANPPSLSLLPFESTASINLRSRDFSTSTTLYRGEISLSFQMDEPFWYSIHNVFGEYVENQITGVGEYQDTWTDANGTKINVFDPQKNQDAIKIMLEDGIPLSSMIQSNMLMGNDLIATVSQDDGAIIADDSFKFVCTKLPLTEEEIQQGIEDNRFKVEYYRATYDVIDEVNSTENSQVIITLFENDPSYTIIFDENLTSLGSYEEDFQKMFNMTDINDLQLGILAGFTNGLNTYTTDIWMDSEQNHRLSDPEGETGNSGWYTYIQGVMMKEQNGVSVPKGDQNWNFYYAGTAPAYPILDFSLTPIVNEAYYMIVPANKFARQGDLTVNYNTFTIESTEKQEFKFTTPNIYTSYNTAIQIFKMNADNSLIGEIYPLIRENVKHYVVRAKAIAILDGLGLNDTDFTNEKAIEACDALRQLFYDDNKQEYYSAHFTFNSKTGIATGTFTINDEGTPKTLTENVGDMIKSDWLVIKERNRPTDDNLIRAWTDAIEDGELFSHRLYHNVQGGLEEVKLTYNNMYL